MKVFTGPHISITQWHWQWRTTFFWPKTLDYLSNFGLVWQVSWCTNFLRLTQMRHKEEYRVFQQKKAVLLWSYPHWIVMDLLIGTKNIPWRSESKNHPSASIRCTKWVLAIFQYDCRSAWELCVKLRIFVGRWFLDPEEGTAQIRNVNWRQGKEQKSKCSKCGTQTKRRVSRAGPRRFLRQSADICGGEGWDLGPKCRSSASSVV